MLATSSRAVIVSRSAVAAILAVTAACARSEPVAVGASVSADRSPACGAFMSEVRDGGPGKDGIPALTNPTLVSPDDPGASYLRPDDRVIGVLAGGEAVAVPLNIGWWHEIVNLEVGGEALAITHCPLTGSSLVFDRTSAGGAEFGVSGLLFRNNLVMYDRTAEESLWPQMERAARCGPAGGSRLTMYPAFETTWAAWMDANPGTRVVSSATGHLRNYQVYPYGPYDQLHNGELLFPMPLDPRRPPKERVLGLPSGTGGVAYPFLELEKLGAAGVIRHAPLDEGGMTEPRQAVVFWDGLGRGASVFSPEVGEYHLSFHVASGEILDDQTGSTWRTDGLAVSGLLTGTRLEGIPEAYVAYWFAWAMFAPHTEIWRAP